MPRGGNTWQARGTYLAGCLGLTAPIFGAGIDKAMATARQGTAANPGGVSVPAPPVRARSAPEGRPGNRRVRAPQLNRGRDVR